MPLNKDVAKLQGCLNALDEQISLERTLFAETMGKVQDSIKSLDSQIRCRSSQIDDAMNELRDLNLMVEDAE